LNVPFCPAPRIFSGERTRGREFSRDFAGFLRESLRKWPVSSFLSP